ncbi:MAG: ABC transporter permease [Solirubrobacterales bacterium]
MANARSIEMKQPAPAPSAPPPESPTTQRLTEVGLDWAMRYGLLILLGLVVLFFATYSKTSGTYLSHANLVSLVGNQAVVSIVAMAALVPLTAGYIDLSCGAVTGVSSIVCAALLSKAHTSTVEAVALGILAGLLLGAVNGVLIARFKLSSIIATLGTSTALTGGMLWYTKGTTIGSNLPAGFTSFGSLNWLGVPRVAFVMVPVLLICWFLLENTPFGRYLQAVASNRRSAHLVGIPVDRAAFAAFLLSGLLAGIAGVLLTARSGAADSTTGPSYLFPALTAVFLGATAIHPGRPNMWGTTIGIFFIAFALSGLSLMGASTWAPDLFNGVTLVVAASLASIFARRRGGGPRLF